MITAPSTSVKVEDLNVDDVWKSTRVRIPLGEWWKIHIFSLKDLDHANIAVIEDPPNLMRR